MQDGKAAMADIERAIQLNPKLAEAYFIRGFIKYNAKEMEGAFKDFTTAIRLDPASSEAYRLRAPLRGDWDGAMADLTKAIEIDTAKKLPPENIAGSWLSLGELKEHHGDAKGAAEAYAKSLAIRPSREVYRDFARLKYESGEMKGALADADKSLALNANDGDALYYRGMAEQALGKTDAALADLDNAVKNGAHPEYFAGRAVVRQAKGDTGGAAADLKRAGRTWLEESVEGSEDGGKLLEESAPRAVEAGTAPCARAHPARSISSPPRCSRITRGRWRRDALKNTSRCIRARRLLYCLRGYLRFDARDFKGAAADFSKAVALDGLPDVSRDYSHFYLWLCRARWAGRRRGRRSCRRGLSSAGSMTRTTGRG